MELSNNKISPWPAMERKENSLFPPTPIMATLLEREREREEEVGGAKLRG